MAKTMTIKVHGANPRGRARIVRPEAEAVPAKTAAVPAARPPLPGRPVRGRAFVIAPASPHGAYRAQACRPCPGRQAIAAAHSMAERPHCVCLCHTHP
jgi:hypothetical protein